MREFWDAYYDGKKCACCHKTSTTDVVQLLVDNNLVWDADFDNIRLELADLLRAIDRYVSRTGKDAIKPELDNLTKKLVG